MPSRILRDGILNSKPVNRLSMLAELWYRHLMSVVDDYGRYYADPAILRTATFPLRLGEVTEQDVAGWLKECVEQGLVTVYDDGNTLVMRKFGQRYRSRSKFCAPPDSELSAVCPQPDSALSAVCPQPDSGMSAGCQTQTETESETKTETKTGEEPPANSPHPASCVPSIEEVIAYGREIGCPEAACRRFFHHFNGKARGWQSILWKKRLIGWHQEDGARDRQKPKKPKGRWPLEDFM